MLPGYLPNPIARSFTSMSMMPVIHCQPWYVMLGLARSFALPPTWQQRSCNRSGWPPSGLGWSSDQSFDKFSIPVGPGQVWDTTFRWDDVEGYSEISNPIPVTLPIDQNLTIGEYCSGSPYLGNNEPLPPGTITYNQCGEYYHVAHNHALQQITSWGLTMSGQLTFTRIDPPQPNNCP